MLVQSTLHSSDAGVLDTLIIIFNFCFESGSLQHFVTKVINHHANGHNLQTHLKFRLRTILLPTKNAQMPVEGLHVGLLRRLLMSMLGNGSQFENLV